MKEFDYEKARAGAPVCTRAGNNARIICWDRKAHGRPILALIEFQNGFEQVMKYHNNGKFFSLGKEESLDLMMKDE